MVAKLGIFFCRFAEGCCKFDARNNSMTPTESCGPDIYERVEHPNTPLGFDMSNRVGQ